jgi:hypothetical protein
MHRALPHKGLRLWPCQSKQAFCLLLAIIFEIAGCAQTPQIYTMDALALETVRGSLSTIGVHLSPSASANEVLLPAKGLWGGMKRGVVVGTSLPVMIGFVAPIPGGTALGLLVAPLGAIVGCVYGAAAAVPAEEVKQAKIVLQAALDGPRINRLRDRFLNQLIDMGNARTDLTFVPFLKGNPVPPAMTARLEVAVEKTGLRGMYSIDPPTAIFLQIRAQLVHLGDGTILLDEQLTCASEEQRLLRAWAIGDGMHLVDEIEGCVPELAEKLIDDFFRVHPLRWDQSPTEAFEENTPMRDNDHG